MIILPIFSNSLDVYCASSRLYLKSYLKIEIFFSEQWPKQDGP